MLFSSSILLFSIDPSIGRIDKASMSQQTLMELLISDFDDKNVFRASGDFQDISDWAGVTFNPIGDIIGIHWKQDMEGLGFDVAGFIRTIGVRGGSIDLQWLPSALEILKIPDLRLRGTIDTLDLPRGLTQLQVDRNSFEGPFETSGLPETLIYINAESNKMSGSIDLLRLPSVLIGLKLEENAFSGTLDFSCLPPSLGYLTLWRNSFSGTMDLSNIPKSMIILRLEENNFGPQKSLTVMRVHRANITLDLGDIEDVRDTDGKSIQTVLLGSGNIRLMMDFELG